MRKTGRLSWQKDYIYLELSISTIWLDMQLGHRMTLKYLLPSPSPPQKSGFLKENLLAVWKDNRLSGSSKHINFKGMLQLFNLRCLILRGRTHLPSCNKCFTRQLALMGGEWWNLQGKIGFCLITYLKKLIKTNSIYEVYFGIAEKSGNIYWSGLYDCLYRFGWILPLI